MRLFLGIDGGGTKTIAHVADENGTLGEGRAGACNLVRCSEAQAEGAIREAVEQACATAAVTPRQIERACAGVAGVGSADVAERMRLILEKVVAAPCLVVSDADTALAAAGKGRPAVVTIAGTGSISFGRNAGGESARAGGWGCEISDEGSAFWIGKQAVMRSFREFDEKGESTVLDRIVAFWGVTDKREAVRIANAHPRPAFDSLAPLVDAAQNDPLAKKILLDAATELARATGIVLNALFEGGAAVALGMAGGVFANCETVREAFRQRVQSMGPNVDIADGIIEPVEGAIHLARGSWIAEKG